MKPHEQAFPSPRDDAYPSASERGAPKPGLTARQHAAIALCVPASGEEWLDSMIRARLRDEYAAKAMHAVTTTDMWLDPDDERENGESDMEQIAILAYEMADAMLAASKKGGEK